jgi:hypothetical protein
MDNVVFQVEGHRLVIVVDLSQEVGESSSGKSIILASSGGNVSVPGFEDIKIGLNVYRPQPQTGRGLRHMAKPLAGVERNGSDV